LAQVIVYYEIGEKNGINSIGEKATRECYKESHPSKKVTNIYYKRDNTNSAQR
jgi:hypothetical protein